MQLEKMGGWKSLSYKNWNLSTMQNECLIKVNPIFLIGINIPSTDVQLVSTAIKQSPSNSFIWKKCNGTRSTHPVKFNRRSTTLNSPLFYSIMRLRTKAPVCTVTLLVYMFAYLCIAPRSRRKALPRKNIKYSTSNTRIYLLQYVMKPSVEFAD